MLTITNEDNMAMMARYPDKYFDLAIVDPPYGINADIKNSTNIMQSKKSATNSKYYGNKNWDNDIPNAEYFNELIRVSNKQIIWGANYFGLKGGYLYWHKNVTMPTYSTGELAWISWLNKLEYVNISWHGMIQQDMKNKETRIHPTQKPVALYKWLLDKYAKQGDKILDTHLGSGSIAIACHDYGFDLTACELDSEYYDKAMQRINNHIMQQKLF
jgi:site-specific DNA-methyltransferase (adenine-specific)